MDIKTAIEQAGGVGAIAKAINNRMPDQTITAQAIINWRARGRMPRTEWTADTRYAEIICDLARAFGHNIHPLELCPGAGQYMIAQEREAA